jgi:hypothetical protein
LGFDGPEALAEARKMQVFRAKLFDIKTLTAIKRIRRANYLILNEASSELSWENSLTLYLSRL